MKTCKICKETKDFSDFLSNGFQPSGKKKYKVVCKSCGSQDSRTKHIARIKTILKQTGRKYQCERCGYKKNYAGLTFHHLDEMEKEDEISEMRTASLEKLMREIDICLLLCHNCHMEEHYPHLDIVDDED